MREKKSMLINFFTINIVVVLELEKWHQKKNKWVAGLRTACTWLHWSATQKNKLGTTGISRTDRRIFHYISRLTLKSGKVVIFSWPDVWSRSLILSLWIVSFVQIIESNASEPFWNPQTSLKTFRLSSRLRLISSIWVPFRVKVQFGWIIISLILNIFHTCLSFGTC